MAAQLNAPRNQVQQWIRAGRVQVAGRDAKASHVVAAGERIVCDPPPRDTAAGLDPEAGDLVVLHEDESLAAIDKPAGLAVHPGAGRRRGTLVNRLLARFPEISEVGGPGRPGIVHRLDLDTTGVLVVARTPEAYQRLSAAFAAREIDKRYLAIAFGCPSEETGCFEGAIGRHPKHRKQMAVVPRGRPARTDYRRLACAAGLALLELGLVTGRTHQIRVHLKAAGHPLVGDPVYGEARWKALPAAVRRPLEAFPRPALHAWRLTLPHPTTGRPLSLEAPIPEDLRTLWLQVTGHPLSL